MAKGILIGAFLIFAIFIFTNNFFYCIIFLLSSFLSISSFFIMVKLLDRIFNKGKGRAFYFILYLAKFLLLIGVFFFAINISEKAILFQFLGISTMVVAAMIESISLFIRTTFHGA
jgi:hypothetical protein